MSHGTQSARLDAVLLAGPTASGKSALALRIAEGFGGEIVNVDSMQVYRDLMILSTRPGAGDLARAPHHLYGHVDASVNHSAGLWREEARLVLDEVRARGCLPILAGGTGLYFKALEQGLAEMPPVPPETRERVRREAEDQPTPTLHRQLMAVDAQTGSRLRPNDRQRILRALEILAATGRSLAAWQAEPHSPPLLDPQRCLRLFLEPGRETLYRAIDARFDAMVAAGALDEAAQLMRRELDPALPAMRAHGVPGLIRHLRGETSLASAADGRKPTRGTTQNASSPGSGIRCRLDLHSARIRIRSGCRSLAHPAAAGATIVSD